MRGRRDTKQWANISSLNTNFNPYYPPKATYPDKQSSSFSSAALQQRTDHCHEGSVKYFFGDGEVSTHCQVLYAEVPGYLGHYRWTGEMANEALYCLVWQFWKAGLAKIYQEARSELHSIYIKLNIIFEMKGSGVNVQT